MQGRGDEQHSCKDKRYYENRSRAKRVAAIMRKRADRDEDRIREYSCKFCGGWHVGHSVPASVRAAGLVGLYIERRRRNP